MTRGQTRVAVDGEAWLINGEPTYRGREYRGWPIEGRLLNSRMANAIFDDANPATRFLWRYPDTGRWDADRNTDEFVRCLPVYREHGLTAVTVNLQGGAPFGYYREARFRELLVERQVASTDAELWRGLPGPASQPWHNSPFGANGALAQEPGGHLTRLSRILRRTDELGMVVVLGILYFGQDERLRDEAAVCRAVEETCGWVLQEGWRNVVVEIKQRVQRAALRARHPAAAPRARADRACPARHPRRRPPAGGHQLRRRPGARRRGVRGFRLHPAARQRRGRAGADCRHGGPDACAAGLCRPADRVHRG